MLILLPWDLSTNRTLIEQLRSHLSCSQYLFNTKRKVFFSSVKFRDLREYYIFYND